MNTISLQRRLAALKIKIAAIAINIIMNFQAIKKKNQAHVAYFFNSSMQTTLNSRAEYTNRVDPGIWIKTTLG